MPQPITHARTHRRTHRRVGVVALALLALVASACERNADGSYSVDQAFLCVKPADGAIRWTANKDCGADELLVRVDEPAAGPPVDLGPQPTSWAGEVSMGATSASVSADGAAVSQVQLVVEETSQLGPNAKCDLVYVGATTRVLGDLWAWGIVDVAHATVEWADPDADNSVEAACTGQSGYTQPVDLILSLVPVG